MRATTGMPRIGRRALLRGACGSAVALPWLEIMRGGPAAHAAPAAPPRRYFVCFAGTSIGGDGDRKHNELVPDRTGADYDLKTALLPLGKLDVQRHVSVVSGLAIPASGPTGLRGTWHAGSMSPLLAGVPGGDQSTVLGTSSDQIVADAIGGQTRFKHLAYRAQPAGYADGPFKVRDSICYRKEAAAEARKLSMEASPRAAYDALFYNFARPGDPAEAARRDAEWRQRRSVIDLVRDAHVRLLGRVGTADRQRIERHLDEIRELERQVSVAATSPVGATCSQPPAPGADPPLGGANTKSGGMINFDVNLGYSNEEDRARAFADLVHMAFACDLARVSALMLTMAQSYMNVYHLLGFKTDVHQVSHYGAGADTTHKVSLVVAWHVKHFAYLVRKLADTPEGAGTLLDSTAAVFLTEGGHGAGDGKAYSAHSGQNMAVLIAGRAGGLRAGLHLPAPGLHPANVLVSAMAAVGVPGGRLGNVSGEAPGLRA